MVERDDFLEMLPLGSVKPAGGANPAVWIGVGSTRPVVSRRKPSRASAASAIDECDDMCCKRCDVVEGLDSVVAVKYAGWGLADQGS